MKKILLTLVAVTSMSAIFAQIDSTTTNSSDTIKVGNYVIVKKQTRKSVIQAKQKISFDLCWF